MAEEIRPRLRPLPWYIFSGVPGGGRYVQDFLVSATGSRVGRMADDLVS
jgi:hypothetical protein